MSILIDTGPLYAFFDKRDQYNHWTGLQFAQISSPLITCEAVIAETVFLMSGSGINPDRLFEFSARGHLQVQSVVHKRDEMARIRTIVNTYRNLPASFADACLVRMYELQRNSEIFTLDSHFSIYRTSGGNSLSLIIP